MFGEGEQGTQQSKVKEKKEGARPRQGWARKSRFPTSPR